MRGRQVESNTSVSVWQVNLGIPDVKMMTFGQPRVGNKMFAQFFNSQVKNSVRMTHGHDPVPHLPPPSPFGGTYSYYHVATEVKEEGLSAGAKWDGRRMGDG